MGIADPALTAAPEVGTQGGAPKLDEVLDDLAMRFVINCPVEEQESFERLLFQVEAAFWFYEDQYREIWPDSFPNLTLLSFSQKMFESCPLLQHFKHKTKEIYTAFTQYKQQIPTCGAAILNPQLTKLLLVRSYQGKSWGFPKGKIDKDETKESCAAREVLEEVGYDILPYLDPEAYVEMQWQQGRIRLYLVCGVPEDTVFITRTKKEIGEIAWHKIKELPASKEESQANATKKTFWMVAPFVAKLRRYIAEANKKGKKLKGQKPAPAPSAEPPAPTPPQKSVQVMRHEPPWSCGTTVLAKYSAESKSWKKATVVSHDGSDVTVRFDGYADGTVIPATRIKAFDASTAPSTPPQPAAAGKAMGMEIMSMLQSPAPAAAPPAATPPGGSDAGKELLQMLQKPAASSVPLGVAKGGGRGGRGGSGDASAEGSGRGRRGRKSGSTSPAPPPSAAPAQTQPPGSDAGKALLQMLQKPGDEARAGAPPKRGSPEFGRGFTFDVPALMGAIGDLGPATLEVQHGVQVVRRVR